MQKETSFPNTRRSETPRSYSSLKLPKALERTVEFLTRVQRWKSLSSLRLNQNMPQSWTWQRLYY